MTPLVKDEHVALFFGVLLFLYVYIGGRCGKLGSIYRRITALPYGTFDPLHVNTS